MCRRWRDGAAAAGRGEPIALQAVRKRLIEDRDETVTNATIRCCTSAGFRRGEGRLKLVAELIRS
jgi:hypothetical protein